MDSLKPKIEKVSDSTDSNEDMDIEEESAYSVGYFKTFTNCKICSISLNPVSDKIKI